MMEDLSVQLQVIKNSNSNCAGFFLFYAKSVCMRSSLQEEKPFFGKLLVCQAGVNQMPHVTSPVMLQLKKHGKV